MNATPKERPILFSGPMVNAILGGHKTMTRRVVKPNPPDWITEFSFSTLTPPGCISGIGDYEDCGPAHKFFKSPYGIMPGEQLWVREAFSLVPCSAGVEKYPDGFDPKKSSASQPKAPGYGVRYKSTWDRCHSCGWKPSIHMPRWASRITLEITSVRVERLQAITEADAMAEGVDAIPAAPAQFTRRGAFIGLWDAINGKSHPWQSNPWVWVVAFKRIKP